MRLLVLNLFRKPLRTLLTIFGVGVALFLFCFLEAVLDAFQVGVNMADASRLVVMHKESLSFNLPISHRAAIEQIEGVKRASNAIWFGGPYEEPTSSGAKKEDFFAQFAVDLDTYLASYPEIKIPPEQLRDVMSDPSGCILGEKLAQRLNKKIGDKLTFKGAIWSKADGTPWDFTVRAIYSSDSPTFDQTMMLFHWKYLDEGRAYERGTATIFIVGIDDPNRYQQIASAVDSRFENSPGETRTMTEKAFNMQFVSMMGNLSLLLRSIGSAVVLTMLLVAANTMMMSARERTREMGILKAIGFTDGHIFRLLVGEALLIAMSGAVLGAGFAVLLFNVLGMNPKADFFPVFQLPVKSIFVALGIAAITGLLSGLVPAYTGMRMKATEALRTV
jgi:putative ABC transport system permease protein